MKLLCASLLIAGGHRAPFVQAADVSFYILGNDDTSANRMPEILAEMLEEEDTVTEFDWETGNTFEEYAQEATSGGRVGRILNETQWTWVILQEDPSISSQIGVDLNVYGASQTAAQELASFIEAPGTGESVIFLTPQALLDADYLATQDKQIEGYEGYASATGGGIAPAGDAFKILYNSAVSAGEDPLTGDFADLYANDQERASRSGSFLVACVLYGTLTGRNPMLLSTTPQGLDEEETAELLGACVQALNDRGATFPTPSPVAANTPTAAPVEESTMEPTLVPGMTSAPTTAAPTSGPTTAAPTVGPSTAEPSGSMMPTVSDMPSFVPTIEGAPTPDSGDGFTIAPDGTTLSPATTMAPSPRNDVAPVFDILRSSSRGVDLIRATSLAVATTVAMLFA